MAIENVILGPGNKEFSIFSDPQIFFFSDCRVGQIKEPFWYCRKIFNKFLKVENRAKFFFEIF